MQNLSHPVKFLIYILFWLLLTGPLFYYYNFQFRLNGPKKETSLYRSKRTPLLSNIIRNLKSTQVYQPSMIMVHGVPVQAANFIWTGDFDSFDRSLRENINREKGWKVVRQDLGQSQIWTLFPDSDIYHQQEHCTIREGRGILSLLKGVSVVSLLRIQTQYQGFSFSPEHMGDLTKILKKPPTKLNVAGISLLLSVDFQFSTGPVATRTLQGETSLAPAKSYAQFKTWAKQTGFIPIQPKNARNSDHPFDQILVKGPESLHITIKKARGKSTGIAIIRQNGPHDKLTRLKASG